MSWIRTASPKQIAILVFVFMGIFGAMYLLLGFWETIACTVFITVIYLRACQVHKKKYAANGKNQREQ